MTDLISILKSIFLRALRGSVENGGPNVVVLYLATAFFILLCIFGQVGEFVVFDTYLLILASVSNLTVGYSSTSEKSEKI
jgi:hypothetical protein